MPQVRKSSKMYRFHIRRHNQEGKVLSQGGVTVTTLFEEDETTNNGVVYNVVAGVSYCSINDSYNKAKGVDIAAGRMDKKPIYIKGFLWSDALTADQNLCNLMQTVINADKNKPTDRWWKMQRANGISLHQRKH